MQTFTLKLNFRNNVYCSKIYAKLVNLYDIILIIILCDLNISQAYFKIFLITFRYMDLKVFYII